MRRQQQAGGQPGIRLSAVANDGVISGHGITFASSNLGQVKTDFHISNTSQTEIYSKYFSQANATNANIGSVLIGATEYVIDFNTDYRCCGIDPSFARLFNGGDGC